MAPRWTSQFDGTVTVPYVRLLLGYLTPAVEPTSLNTGIAEHSSAAPSLTTELPQALSQVEVDTASEQVPRDRALHRRIRAANEVKSEKQAMADKRQRRTDTISRFAVEVGCSEFDARKCLADYRWDYGAALAWCTKPEEKKMKWEKEQGRYSASRPMEKPTPSITEASPASTSEERAEATPQNPQHWGSSDVPLPTLPPAPAPYPSPLAPATRPATPATPASSPSPPSPAIRPAIPPLPFIAPAAAVPPPVPSTTAPHAPLAEIEDVIPAVGSVSAFTPPLVPNAATASPICIVSSSPPLVPEPQSTPPAICQPDCDVAASSGEDLPSNNSAADVSDSTAQRAAPLSSSKFIKPLELDFVAATQPAPSGNTCSSASFGQSARVRLSDSIFTQPPTPPPQPATFTPIPTVVHGRVDELSKTLPPLSSHSISHGVEPQGSPNVADTSADPEAIMIDLPARSEDFREETMALSASTREDVTMEDGTETAPGQVDIEMSDGPATTSLVNIVPSQPISYAAAASLAGYTDDVMEDAAPTTSPSNQSHVFIGASPSAPLEMEVDSQPPSAQAQSSVAAQLSMPAPPTVPDYPALQLQAAPPSASAAATQTSFTPPFGQPFGPVQPTFPAQPVSVPHVARSLRRAVPVYPSSTPQPAHSFPYSTLAPVSSARHPTPLQLALRAPHALASLPVVQSQPVNSVPTAASSVLSKHKANHDLEEAPRLNRARTGAAKHDLSTQSILHNETKVETWAKQFFRSDKELIQTS